MFVGPVKVDIAYTQPDRRIRDLDNLAKAVLDSLTHAGAWEDDAQVHDLHVAWGHERHPCAVVEIESIAETG
jgi:crossover junction endodeoxyribonuclease RusA